jgi:hypothetical protein
MRASRECHHHMVLVSFEKRRPKYARCSHLPGQKTDVKWSMKGHMFDVGMAPSCIVRPYYCQRLNLIFLHRFTLIHPSTCNSSSLMHDGCNGIGTSVFIFCRQSESSKIREKSTHASSSSVVWTWWWKYTSGHGEDKKREGYFSEKSIYVDCLVTLLTYFKSHGQNKSSSHFVRVRAKCDQDVHPGSHGTDSFDSNSCSPKEQKKESDPTGRAKNPI